MLTSDTNRMPTLVRPPVVALILVGVVALGVFWIAVAIDRRHTASRAAIMLADLGASIGSVITVSERVLPITAAADPDDASAPGWPNRWAWSAVQVRGVVMAGVATDDGVLHALAPLGDIRFLDDISTIPGRAPCRYTNVTVNGDSRRVMLATSPLPGAPGPAPAPANRTDPVPRHVFIAVDPAVFGPGPATGDIWFPVVLMLAVGSAGALVVRQMKHNVVTPLRALRRHHGETYQQWLAHLPGERPDLIGAAGRDIRQTVAELVQSRWDCHRLEATLDDQIAHRTQRMDARLRRAEREAWTDSLTGLGNRRLLDDRFPQLFHTQRKRRRDLTVVVFDLDGFKNHNDTLGHDSGDELLRFVGELLTASLRCDDVAIRYGGDEFVVVLPDTDDGAGAAIAERVVKLFRQRPVPRSGASRVSVSAGVASLRSTRPPNAETLLKMADEALYAAKRRGRNNVVVHGRRQSCPVANV